MKRIFASILGIIIFIGFLIPQNLKMPVVGASKKDYNATSFWFFPWGKSGTHKGVDIFAKKGVALQSSTKGIVISSGINNLGGKYILILGPKWRLHYYAHLDKVLTQKGQYVNHKSIIGKIGDSGNAKGKSPHLHYSIFTIIPYPWRIDTGKQGWKKMFYLNPIDCLK